MQGPFSTVSLKENGPLQGFVLFTYKKNGQFRSWISLNCPSSHAQLLLAPTLRFMTAYVTLGLIESVA